MHMPTRLHTSSLRQCCRLEGRQGRRSGGQGLVAFATDTRDGGKPYALKLYSSEVAFARERDAVSNEALKPAMPACHAIVDRETAINDGPLAGTVLPCMTITERGENLIEYARRVHPDFDTSVQVRKVAGVSSASGVSSATWPPAARGADGQSARAGDRADREEAADAAHGGLRAPRPQARQLHLAPAAKHLQPH